MKTTSFIPLIFVLSPGNIGRLKTEINIGEGDQSETAVNGQKIVYTYGSSGDIIKREYYDVQASLGSIFTRQTVVRTDSFGYTNSNWKNQCDSTNINGVSSALSYDAIGNPLTYRDGMQMTWQNGRQLKKLTAPNGKMLRFSYDINGQRQAKIERNYGNVVHTTKYFYDGTKLAGEKKDDTIVWYDYDENGAPVGMRVNGLDYIFRKNLQGDITGIYNSSDELIVEYSYADAWGAGVTVSGSAASTIGMYNSFRYRGYYYDTESGLYYLNSRYYDPVACRFINADELLNETNMRGYNLYSYCFNNPVMYIDPDGTCPYNGTAADFRNLEAGRLPMNCTCVGTDIKIIVKGSYNKDTPPDHSDFNPPKKGTRKVKNPNGQGNGWLAKDGGVWVWTPNMHGGEGWTIQYPGGDHSHAYPGGKVRNHFSSGQSTEDAVIKIFVGAAATAFLVADDITIAGIADDGAVLASTGLIVVGLNGIFGEKTCACCGAKRYGY